MIFLESWEQGHKTEVILSHLNVNAKKSLQTLNFMHECFYLSLLSFLKLLVFGCVVVLWHNESVNVNPGLSFSVWYSLAH